MRSTSTRTTGLLLVVLGVWGGLVPFVGHYFHFALGPDKAWTWTTARLYLDVLPGVATVLGGLILVGAGPRASARFGALLALAGGIWFAIGPEISQLWHAGGAQGAGHGSANIQMLEMLTYHTGLGVVIAALAGYAFPRFRVVEEEEVAASRRGRGAAAGVSAGAGTLPGPRDRRAYDETGEPMADHEAARPESGTGQHHLGRDAAIGAGAAGAAAAAERHHREHIGEEDALGDPVGASGAAQGDAVPADAGTRQHHPGRDAVIGAGAAGAVAAEHRHREHVAEEEAAAHEPEAERNAAGDPGEPSPERDVTGAADAPVAERDTAGTADQPVASDAGPATATESTPPGGHPEHRTMRRRRGGLLGSLLRR
jgi:hypothetical protein